VLCVVWILPRHSLTPLVCSIWEKSNCNCSFYTVSVTCSLVSTRGPPSPWSHSLLELHSPQSLSALISVHCTQLFPIMITMFPHHHFLSVYIPCLFSVCCGVLVICHTPLRESCLFLFCVSNCPLDFDPFMNCCEYRFPWPDKCYCYLNLPGCV